MTEMIDRNNYETYFIDHLDGRLSPEAERELMLFLEENSDLATELDGLENTSLISTPEVFDTKSLLKKSEIPLSPSEIDTLLARKLEGDLSDIEIVQAEALIESYPQIARTEAAFAKTKITPAAIEYPEKEKLRIPGVPDMNDVQMLMVAKIEGDLTQLQDKKLSGLLGSSAALRSDLNQFYKTKLKAGSEVFEAKAVLRKKAGMVIPLRRIVYVATAAAAAVVLWVAIPNEPTTARLATRIGHNFEVPKAIIGASAHVPDDAGAEENNSDSPASSIQNAGNTIHHIARGGNENQENNHDYAGTRLPPEPDTPEKIQLLGFNGFDAVLVDDGLAMNPRHEMPFIHDRVAASAIRVDAKNYISLGEYLTGKAKETLWGSSNYPEDKFALALVEKEFQKRIGHAAPAIEYERKKTNDENSFRLRFWKFEFERKRK